MTYIVAILIAFALLSAFLSLTYFESAKGVRVLGSARRRLDRKVGQVSFIIAHVDLGAFVRDSIRDGFERIVHDIAHASLMIVRLVERVLTRFVRKQRGKQEAPDAPPKRTFREAIHHVRSTIRLRRISIREKTEGTEG